MGEYLGNDIVSLQHTLHPSSPTHPLSAQRDPSHQLLHLCIPLTPSSPLSRDFSPSATLQLPPTPASLLQSGWGALSARLCWSSGPHSAHNDTCGLSKAPSSETHIDPLTLWEHESCCVDPRAPPEMRVMNLNAAA